MAKIINTLENNLSLKAEVIKSSQGIKTMLLLLALILATPYSSASCTPLAQLRTKGHWDDTTLLTSLCSDNQILSSINGALKLRKADAAQVELITDRYRRIYETGAALKLQGCTYHQVEMKFYQDGKEMAPIVLCPEGDDLKYVAFKETFFIESAGARAVNEAPQDSVVVLSLGLEFVDIPSGSFQMGSKEGEGDSDERPAHRVDVPAFKLMKYEVTQGQWQAVMGSNPSYFTSCGSDCPVEQVSWDDVQGFIQKLNAKTGQKYRLPSESEWEYAARAGSATKYSWGNDISCSDARYDGSKGSQCYYQLANNNYRGTTKVGSYRVNGFGLYNMHGNVFEWTQDCWNDSYSAAPMDGSAWESGDCAKRVLRGGSWLHRPDWLRSASRYGLTADSRSYSLGFRLVQGR